MIFIYQLQKNHECIKFMFVNIMDPKIKGKDIVQMMSQLIDSKINLWSNSMRIMQRSKSDTLFKNEKEKFDFMNKMFIENVWCFES